MSEAIIRAIGLTKTFRLYRKPHYRFLDMFGLLQVQDGYQEHVALNALDLDIYRGEKVAFIGRNGAGKSTLLRLITGVTQPSAGILEVKQGANALLQIGTGFHPDFSGVENARAYLAHLGVTGKEADSKIGEIVEFSELEQYIDQPVKTYSSGMMARLMFAVSTAIAPDLLVLDEILGVGDAYFANKSFERIQELAEEEKTTVLLVSHDIYSAAKLCSRMIWLDRGSKLVDGPSDEVIRAYEHSIRLQEESRLRVKAAAQKNIQNACIIELSLSNKEPLRGRIMIAHLRLTDANGGLILDAPLNGTVSELAFEPSLGLVEHQGRKGQDLLRENVAVNRARLTFSISPDHLNAISSDCAKLSLAYMATDENLICVDVWYKEKCLVRGFVRMAPGTENDWTNAQLTLEKPLNQFSEQSSLLGTGRIWIEDFEIFDNEGQPCHVFTPRNRLQLQCRYRAHSNGGYPIPVEFLIAVHRDGVNDVVRMVGAETVIPANSSGHLSFVSEGWELARGRFTFTIIAVKPGYYDKNDGKFFSINDDVYCCVNKGLEVLIDGGSNQLSGTNVRVPMTVNLHVAPE